MGQPDSKGMAKDGGLSLTGAPFDKIFRISEAFRSFDATNLTNYSYSHNLSLKFDHRNWTHQGQFT